MSNASEEPWYRDGLRFECTQCGNCCTGSPGYVWVNEEEIRAIAEHLDQPHGAIRLLYTRPARGKVSLTEFANGDCVFFDAESRGCKIYPVRPMQCRTWPFWQSNLYSEEAWERTERNCPGSGCGPLVSLQEIQSRVEQSGI
ncbi:YkgJ family cysteine cluster protein [Planctomicrobium sp. SH664]|uniref:YkgJ family cysteine cluster protein n=1 Tax=Planctomicrobium sp. SH664 TaxID=3448125 RepID=UPI003F5B25B1